MDIQIIIESAISQIAGEDPAVIKDEQVRYFINRKIEELEAVIIEHNHDSQQTQEIIEKLEDIKDVVM